VNDLPMRFEFARPDVLFLLLFLPLWWMLVWPRVGGGVLHTRGDLARGLSPWWIPGSTVVLALPRLVRLLAMSCLVVALAGPQWVETVRQVTLRGTEMALAIDLSTSMLAEDMEAGRSRLEVTLEAAKKFAADRHHDELSLVVFAAEARTRVPPTTDPNLIVRSIESLNVEMLPDGTNISSGVLTSVARMMETPREPRVLVLFTDGAHNGTGTTPLEAARTAAALGVKVHTISLVGLGQASNTPPAVRAAMADVRRRMDAQRETALTLLAQLTGGQYFRATGAAELDSIYQQIARLEEPRQEVTESERRHSARVVPLFLGLLLLGGEVLLRGSRWGVVP